MKKIFTVFILIVIYKNACAQAPNWLWAISQVGGNSCCPYSYAVLASPAGNIYMDGRISGNTTLGGVSANGDGCGTVFNGRFDSSGVFKWVSPYPFSSGCDYTWGFARDDSDNTYSTGSEGGPTLFIDKYNKAGMQVWAKIIPTGGGTGIAVDKAGNVYTTGRFGGSISFPGVATLNAIGGNDMYLAKLNSLGVCQWAVSAGGSGDDFPQDLCIDHAGNIYVSGGYTNYSSGAFPSFGNKAALPVSGPGNLFVAKYDNNGNILWVTSVASAGSAGYGDKVSITIDSCDNLYTSGRFWNMAQFGNQSVTSTGSEDIFVAKLLNNGNWEWVKSAGGSGSDVAQSIALDKHFDIYITGYYNGTATFGNQSITSAGGSDVFIAKYANGTGDLQWVQSGGGAGNDNGSGITIDKYGYAYITGSYNGGAATYGSSIISNNASGSNGGVFVAKLDTSPPLQILVFPDSVYCPGSTLLLPYKVIGTFNSGNAFTAQLSDSTGSFASPVTIGTLNSTGNGNIQITIPQNTSSGSNYLIRIISSNPGWGSLNNNCYSVSAFPQLIPGTIRIGNVRIAISADTSVCAGSSVMLGRGGAGNYLWSPASGLSCTNCSTPLATPTLSTTYTVNVSNGLCSSTDSVIVTVNPISILSISPAMPEVCGNQSIILSVNGGGTSFKWSPPTALNRTTGDSVVATGYPSLDSIVYTVTDTSTSVCPATGRVTLHSGGSAIGGTVNAVRDTICLNTPGSLSLSGNSSSAIQWQSSTDDISFTPTGDTGTTYKTPPLNQSIWYFAIVGSGSCSAKSDTLELIVPPVLTASFYAIQTASNTLTFNSDSSKGNIHSYHWDFGDGQTSSEQNPQHTYAKDTIYYVCLTLYDGSNCSYTFCRYSDVTDAIQNLSEANEWFIYPNPFSNGFVINGNDLNRTIENIELYDMLGRQVYNKAYQVHDNAIPVNLSGFAQGMYYLEIKTTNATFFQAMIKQP